MKQWWYFTFCIDGILAKYFVKIYENYDNARSEIVDNFGTRFAFQYNLEEWVNDEGMSVAQIHNLTEIIY